MITGWKITKIDERGEFFRIRPIIVKDENSNSIYDLTVGEYGWLKRWGFFDGDEDIDLFITHKRQVDMLETDFTYTDTSAIRKKAEEMNLPW